VRLVIAGSESPVVASLAAICQMNGWKVLGQCTDGQSALKAIRAHGPDFAILDAEMPALTGLQVVSVVRKSESPTRCIVLGTDADDKSLLQALLAGAEGYLLKGGPVNQLADAFEGIRMRGFYFSPLTKLGQAELTREEWAIFHLRLLQGLDVEEVAKRLGLIPRTVKRCWTLLTVKLHAGGFGDFNADHS
jgi:DNA-binding NarL/FixJ family response regulator